MEDESCPVVKASKKEGVRPVRPGAFLRFVGRQPYASIVHWAEATIRG